MPAPPPRKKVKVGRRPEVLMVALVILGLSVTACGADRSGGITGNPTVLVHLAPARTVAAGTARVDATMDVASGAGLIGTGVVDFATESGEMTFQRTGVQARTRDRYDLVVEGGTGYLAGTGLAVPGGRAWLSGSLPDVAEDAAHQIAPLDSLMVRPGSGLALAYLRGALNVLPYGGEEVEGSSTLRYSFLVDLGQAEAASPPADRPALEAAARFIGPIRFPGDVWLDPRSDSYMARSMAD